MFSISDSPFLSLVLILGIKKALFKNEEGIAVVLTFAIFYTAKYKNIGGVE